MKQNVYMYLEYQTVTLWNDILRDIQILNNLLTLGMNRAVYIDEIHYYHQSHQYERFSELINDMEAFLVDNFLRETYELEEDAEWTDLARSYRKILIAQDEKHSKAIVLKSRLGYLFLARFQYIFSYLGYKMTKFIDMVVDTRNYYTHYSQAKEDKIFSGDELSYVNGILMGVLQYYILQEIGLPMEQIKEKVGRLISSVM